MKNDRNSYGRLWEELESLKGTRVSYAPEPVEMFDIKPCMHRGRSRHAGSCTSLVNCTVRSDNSREGNRIYYNQIWLRNQICQLCDTRQKSPMAAYARLPQTRHKIGEHFMLYNDALVLPCQSCDLVIYGYEVISKPKGKRET